jgi:hypothetical protein
LSPEIEFLRFNILGSKTDANMRGYQACIFALAPIHSRYCPVRLTREYLFRTSSLLGSHAFMVSLDPPFKAIKPTTISNDVTFLFRLAELKLFSGQSIRPTSATLMFSHGVAKEVILKVGRWADESLNLVLRHYVQFSADFAAVSEAFVPVNIPPVVDTASVAQDPTTSVSLSDLPDLSAPYPSSLALSVRRWAASSPSKLPDVSLDDLFAERDSDSDDSSDSDSSLLSHAPVNSELPRQVQRQQQHLFE